MKTIFRLLFITSVFLINMSVSAIAYGQTPTPIIVNPSPNDTRSPEQVPFYAQVWDNYVILGCTTNLGSVEITLTSTAGDDCETVFDTSIGSIIIPISGLSGLYRLDIVLPSGQSYYGEFVL